MRTYRLFFISTFLVSSAFISHDLKASINSMLTEFLSVNLTVLKAKSEIQASKLNIDIVKTKKTWSIVGDSRYYDNTLDSYSPSAFELKNKSASISIIKDFQWGGNLSIGSGFNSLTSTPLLTGTPQELNEFNQTVSYTQEIGANFLGRDFYKQLEEEKNKHQLVSIKSKHTIEQALFGFYLTYISSELNQTLFHLQKNALERAIRRKKLIKKRVSDGVREKIDLYQAKLSEISAEEQLKTSKINLNNSVTELSKLLHRKVQENQVTQFNLKKNGTIDLPDGVWQQNKEHLILSKNISMINNAIERINYSFVPKITLSAQHKTNDYDEKSANSFKNGNIFEDKNETSVGITAIWQIGNVSQKLHKAQSAIKLKTTEMEMIKLEKNFKQSEQSFKKKLSLLTANINSGFKRMELSKQMLSEFNRLYKIGRADIDQVINAEENLINTEKNMAGYLSQKRTTIASLAFLYGKLEEHLKTCK